MSSVEPDRPFALILSRLGGQARARLVEALPAACRDKVVAALEGIDRLSRADMTVVEQILAQEFDRLLGDQVTEQDEFREFYPLRVADVLALVLLKGSSERAAAILPHLPFSVQAECITAIATQDWDALESHLGAEERGLVRDLDIWLGNPPRVARPDLAVAILRNITTPRQLRVLITDIHHRDSEVASFIQASLFSIEDLRRLPDRELQTLTTGIDDWDLAIALLGMTDGLGNRIKANVSHRRAAFLGEDVEYLADTDDEEIQAVCDRMLMRARMLYESGQIQTYLGSVSSELVEPEDDQEEEAVRKPSKRAPQEVEEPKKVKRSFRGIAFAAGGLSLIVGVWFLGVGRSGPRSSNARARVSPSDFSTRQGSEAGGGTFEGGQVTLVIEVPRV